MVLGNRTERRACFDRLELLGIADQHHFGAAPVGFAHHSLHLPSADHPGFVDDEHGLVGQPLAILSPLVFETGDSATGYSRTAFEVLGGNTRQRCAAHVIACRFPSLASHTEHRALARAGIANDVAEPAPFGDMFEGTALFGGQHHAAFLGMLQRALQMPLGDAMMTPCLEPDGGLFQPPFGLDHGARGETVFAASVLAQLHQLGRCPHRRHYLIELILSFAVAMDEHRQVAGGESGLLVSDRLERDFRLRQDLLAIGPGDGVVLLQPLARQPLLGHPRCGRTDLVLGLQLDPLRVQRAMIDPGVDIEFGQALVDVFGPGLAPVRQQFGAVPITDLGTKAIFGHFAHTQHHMGMGLAKPSAPISQWTLRSATMPRDTNSRWTKSRAKAMPSA
ncbi:hypothetical protein WSK_4323 [Novosphingobium sp. Rr 2-17]|nr:hypothetical protein WSK_4323 [Novosphingobium sp. Rr 2-17]